MEGVEVRVATGGSDLEAGSRMSPAQKVQGQNLDHHSVFLLWRNPGGSVGSSNTFLVADLELWEQI